MSTLMTMFAIIGIIFTILVMITVGMWLYVKYEEKLEEEKDQNAKEFYESLRKTQGEKTMDNTIVIDISNEKINSMTDLCKFMAENTFTTERFLILQETKESLEKEQLNSFSPVNRQKSPNIPGYEDAGVYLGKYFYTRGEK